MTEPKEFIADMDVNGRIVVPSHIRRELGVYKKDAKVCILLNVERVYNSVGTTLEVAQKHSQQGQEQKAEVAHNVIL